MRMLNELAEYPLMKRVRGSDFTDDEQVRSMSCRACAAEDSVVQAPCSALL